MALLTAVKIIYMPEVLKCMFITYLVIQVNRSGEDVVPYSRTTVTYSLCLPAWKASAQEMVPDGHKH